MGWRAGGYGQGEDWQEAGVSVFLKKLEELVEDYLEDREPNAWAEASMEERVAMVDRGMERLAQLVFECVLEWERGDSDS